MAQNNYDDKKIEKKKVKSKNDANSNTVVDNNEKEESQGNTVPQSFDTEELRASSYSRLPAEEILVN